LIASHCIDNDYEVKAQHFFAYDLGVEGAGLVPWVGGPPYAFLVFNYEKHSKARPTQKRYYTTRVVRH